MPSNSLRARHWSGESPCKVGQSLSVLSIDLFEGFVNQSLPGRITHGEEISRDYFLYLLAGIAAMRFYPGFESLS